MQSLFWPLQQSSKSKGMWDCLTFLTAACPALSVPMRKCSLTLKLLFLLQSLWSEDSLADLWNNSCQTETCDSSTAVKTWKLPWLQQTVSHDGRVLQANNSIPTKFQEISTHQHRTSTLVIWKKWVRLDLSPGLLWTDEDCVKGSWPCTWHGDLGVYRLFVDFWGSFRSGLDN